MWGGWFLAAHTAVAVQHCDAIRVPCAHARAVVGGLPAGRRGAARAAAQCADSLGQVLARTRTMAGFSLGCCRCLADARCEVSAPQCNREMVELSPGDALQSCLDKSCKSSCSAPHREDPLPAPPPLP